MPSRVFFLRGFEVFLIARDAMDLSQQEHAEAVDPLRRQW